MGSKLAAANTTEGSACTPKDTISVGRRLVAADACKGKVKVGRKLAAADAIEGTA